MDETLRGGASNFRNLKASDPDAFHELTRAAVEQVRRNGTRYRFTSSEQHRGGVIRGAQRTLARRARQSSPWMGSPSQQREG